MNKTSLHVCTMLLFVSLSTAGHAGNGRGDGDKKKKFIDKANMDLSIKPGNLLCISDDNPSRNRLAQMIGDFYQSGMDSIAIEARGYQPVKPELDRLMRISSKQQVLQEAASLRTQALASPLFSMNIGQDRKNVTTYIAQLGQAGTSLPDRDYYLKDDVRSKNIRAAFMDHLAKMFGMIGEDAATAATSADAVLRIETALARAQFSRVEMRDPYKTYNKFAVQDLAKLTPGIAWNELLSGMKIKGVDSVLVNNPAFFKTMDSLVNVLAISDWRSYLRWNILRNAAPYLSSAFAEQDFRFNKVLTGQKEQVPRWQRMSTRIDQSLGDMIGQLYVQQYFKPEARQRMLDLVNNLQETFRERIQRLSWMSDETKSRALEKLNAFSKKIAYPDKWKEYQGVNISRNDFTANIRSTGTWAYNYMINRLGKPVDKTEWGMTPPTVNAYYNAVNNEIAFPAGILQFPFFDFDADDAINYGGIGAVIGHEITHGFDDQGSKYAADGNLKDWWTKEDADKFKLSGERVVNQYNGFTVLDSIHVNGKLTLGENLADLGGLNIAYAAFTKTKQFKEGKLIDGFTPAQRFFLNWAQVWRNNALPETQAQLILTDPHSPGMHRANGPVVNMEAWYKAFNVKPGDKMYIPVEKRILIW